VVADRIGSKKKFTPKGLRRTFNDAARVADLEGVVTMSISGHRTERMKDLTSPSALKSNATGSARSVSWSRP
jgi:integrase